MRDVVVTGMGVVSPYGVGVDALWTNLSTGVSGIDWIGCMDVAAMPVRYAGEVKGFDAQKDLKRPSGVRQDRGMQMGLVAAAGALRQAGLLDDEDRVGPGPVVAAVVGSGLGPCAEAEYAYGCFFSRGWRGVRPTTVPYSMHNALSGTLSVYFNLRGANYVIAAACASGALAIGQAWLAIATGAEEVVLCGGADSPLSPGMFAAWTNLRVLAVHADPRRASRPFDRGRNGLVLAEGAAMVVLESLESARARGVRPLAKMTGCGASSDAHHVTAPQVAGQVLAIRRCLGGAGVRPDQIDYVNAHGTATQQNDRTEAEAIHAVFGPAGSRAPVSSVKSLIGHAMGASGATEFVVCVQAIRQGYVPPTANCDEPDPEIGLDYVPNRGRPHAVRRALSNSFGFGGSNCCLLLERFEG
jgi:3-oxoacyl-[acyl-carrier-protein] synthase II